MWAEIPAWIPLALVAPFIGSFLGVVVVRLPAGRSMIFGRSVCDQCGQTLTVSDLVPVLGWVLRRGRCGTCDARIDPLYPVIELLSLGLVVWAATAMTGALLFTTCLLGWVLLTLGAIDLRTSLLPDALTGLLGAGGLVVTTLFMRDDIAAHLIGGVAGFSVFALVAWVYRSVRQREGLGRGDAKLLGALGFWVAWNGLPTIVLFAASLALAGTVIARAFAHKELAATTRLPFGPFLALAGWLVWLYGPLSLD